MEPEQTRKQLFVIKLSDVRALKSNTKKRFQIQRESVSHTKELSLHNSCSPQDSNIMN